MHRWYVIGLFEKKRLPSDWQYGFMCTWARIAGPYTSQEWAEARARQVTGHYEIRIDGQKWKNVIACVVKAYDLREYGLEDKSQAFQQLAFYAEEEAK